MSSLTYCTSHYDTQTQYVYMRMRSVLLTLKSIYMCGMINNEESIWAMEVWYRILVNMINAKQWGITSQREKSKLF